MKKPIPFWPLLLAAAFLALSLSACSGSGSSADTAYAENGSPAMSKSEEHTESITEMPETDMAEGEAGEGGEGFSVQEASGRKLITTVHLEAETEAYDQFMAWLEGRLAGAGGYMENSDMYSHDENRRWCNLTLRIPAENLGDFLEQLGQKCNILQSSRQEEDVTLSYVDAESHKAALLIEQERLLELLEQAENLEDVLAIEDRLTNVRYQLQNYESMLRVYDNQIDYATLHLSLQEVGELTAPAPETWLSRAWAGMWKNAKDIGRFFQELGLLLVVHLPTLILLAILVLLILFLTRKPRKRARQQRAMIKARQEEARKEMEKSLEQEKKDLD